MRKPIINLFGAPCCGKHDAAEYIQEHLYRTYGIHAGICDNIGLNIERYYNMNITDSWLLTMGLQECKLKKMIDDDGCDIIINLAPLPQIACYYDDVMKNERFLKVMNIYFNRYNNWNYNIMRIKSYEKLFRRETQEESDLFGDKITDFLNSQEIPYCYGEGSYKFYNYIVNDIYDKYWRLKYDRKRT